MSVATSPALWTNLCGFPATDTNLEADCMTGTANNVSPADRFLHAMKNVKQVGLAFGSAGSYASGVAINGATAGIFTVNSFTIGN